MLSRIDEDNGFLNHVAFSDEAAFHTSGKVHCHNCRSWGNENPHVVVEHECGSPKLNVLCCLNSGAVIEPFFFKKPAVTGATYLNMLRDYARNHIPIFSARWGPTSLL